MKEDDKGIVPMLSVPVVIFILLMLRSPPPWPVFLIITIVLVVGLTVIGKLLTRNP